MNLTTTIVLFTLKIHWYKYRSQLSFMVNKTLNIHKHVIVNAFMIRTIETDD